MGSTFATVYMSYRAMAAASAATATVGNNISNMNTEGYTRQKTVLESQTLSGATARFDQSLISTGDGVAATGTTQIRDSFLDARYRAEYADTGRYEAINSGLVDIENVLDEISTNGLQKQFDDLVNQLQNLSQYPTSKDLGMVVRASSQQLTQMLNVYSTQLQQVRDQQAYDLSSVVLSTDFNSTVNSIANLNGQIRNEYLYGNNPNELIDQRNLLIDKLSKMANIKVTVTADEVADGLMLEHVNISLFDENTSASIGIVDHTKANNLYMTDDGSDVKIAMDTTFRMANTPSYVDYDDITKFFTTGSISGYLDLLNGQGDYADTRAGENDFRGVQYYINTLDTFAQTFANTYNNLNSLQTTDAASIEIASSNVGKAFENAGNLLVSYIASYDKLKLYAGTTEVSMADAKDPESGTTVNKIEVSDTDAEAFKFMKDFISEYSLTEGTDYNTRIVTDPVTGSSVTYITLVNSDAISDLIPTTTYTGTELKNLLTGNVGKALDFDVDAAKDYLLLKDRLQLSAGGSSVSMAAAISGTSVDEIKVDAADKDAISFIQKYIKNQDFREGIDYSIDTDGSYIITNPVAVNGLIPTSRLADYNLERANKAMAADLSFEMDELGNFTKVTLYQKNLFTPSDGSSTITADNISISDEWLQDSLFITTTKDSTQANGVSILRGGNDNVLRMISAVSVDQSFNAKDKANTNSLKFTGTYNEYLISMGGTLALDVELNANYEETSQTILTSLDNSRESVSGVSLDEEASNLLTFQSAYNAAARYFTALDEMLDKLINGTGLVGR